MRVLICILLASIAAFAQATDSTVVFGPRISVDARYWGTPGFEPRQGDLAFVHVPADIRSALKDVPERYRMVRASSVEALEKPLRQLNGFRLAAIGVDVSSVEAARRAQALARELGTSFVAIIPNGAGVQLVEQVAPLADVITVKESVEPGRDARAAIEQWRGLYQKVRAANGKVALLHDVPAAAAQEPLAILRNYRGNANLVQGVVVSGADAGSAGRTLRAIRPPLGHAAAVAPDQGPQMFFFTFHWKIPGWQPRKDDWAVAKIRPVLKTFQEKVDYVLKEFQGIPVENRMIMFNALAGAEELLREVIEVRGVKIAAMDYDLEMWEFTPPEEKADPVGACRRGQALADKYGLKFVVTPDNAISRKWGVEIVPHVWGFEPQAKGFQAKNIDEAIVFKRKLLTELRRANPDARLYHDMALQPKGIMQTREGLLRYYAGIADLVEGIEVYSRNEPAHHALMEQFLLGVRPPLRSGKK